LSKTLDWGRVSSNPKPDPDGARMTSRPPPAKESKDDAAARIINTVMFTILLVAVSCALLLDIWRQISHLAQAHAVPTSDQLWQLLLPVSLLLGPISYLIKIYAPRRN
jgi:hypothetical protein